MGLDVGLIQSHERHYGTFVCAICQNMVDLEALVTTKCSHVYCSSCLPFWLEKSSTCPTCNQDLLYANDSSQHHSASMQIQGHQFLVQSLAKSQPLAYRLLKTVLVECPLTKQGVICDWKGDYSDLQSHLLSSTAHSNATGRSFHETSEAKEAAAVAPTPMEIEDENRDKSHRSKETLTLAVSLKEQANGQFESQHYKEALSLYSKAISVIENATDKNDFNEHPELSSLLATLYSNRAATNLQVGEYASCINDCETVYQRLDPCNSKVYIRASRASLQLGDLRQAQVILQRGLDVPSLSTNSLLKKEQRQISELILAEKRGQEELTTQQYATAKGTFGHLLKAAPSAVPFLLGAARADLGLGLTDSALRLTKRILMIHPRSPMGCWVRGQALFLMGEAETGIKMMQEALRLDPDSEEIKRSFRSSKKVKSWMKEAKQKMFVRAFAEAVDLLTSCIDQCDPLPPKSALFALLHTDRAEAFLRLKEYSKALKDCAVVLYAQEDNIPTWLIKFQALHGLDQSETAMDEIKHLLQRFEQDDRLRKAYERADFLIRKKRRVDYYQLLDVPKIASAMEIKKAYKRRSLDFHPDRLPPGSSPEQQQEAQQKFQLLGEGLEILCDDFQRKLYDEGYDAAAIRERVEAANQAAHRHRGYNHYHH
ncbi:chaperone protein DnaJ [Nitzschia inconspicua]|uniref:Chaperone protein DnaJ n=1 Tax=Nitzschia inconspicua TaxID=303405 RepID=A0A9K3PMR0_9STRA|nr:chaperone protein DnaJ [Nitzschia inconspicua]